MKRFLIVFAAMALSVTSLAGRPTGLVVGGGFATDFYNAETVYNYNFVDQQPFWGSYIEIGYDVNVSDLFDLVLSARFSDVYNINVKSCRASGLDFTYISDSFARTYLDIPLKFQFSWNLSPALEIFFDLGPTYNFWISNTSASVKFSKVGETVSKQRDHKNWFQDNPDLYSRHNLCLGGDFGFILHRVKIYAGYDQGVFNFTQRFFYGSPGRTGYARIGALYTF